MVVTHQHPWIFVARYLCQFVHREDRRQAGGRFVPQVVKAQVGEELAVWAPLRNDAFIHVKLSSPPDIPGTSSRGCR